MKRSSRDNWDRRLEYLEPKEHPIVPTSCINLSNCFKKLNVPCALFSTIFILWWTQMMWNNFNVNNIYKHGLYIKNKNVLPNTTFGAQGRRVSIQNHIHTASWDLLGSSKSPSLYTKFNIDGKIYKLEVDTGSFLTWFRCNYKSYQEKTISYIDPYCKKVTGKHNVAVKEGGCLYHVVYEDNSYSEGVVVKSNIQVQITNMITKVNTIHTCEALLGCSLQDFNPIGEYKDVIDGLLGLGRSLHGVQVSLSKYGLPLYFGFCFKDFFNEQDETKVGTLYFGNHHDRDYATSIKWVDIPEDYIFGDEAYELKISKLWIEDDISIPINANMMIDIGAPLTFVEASLFDTLIHYINERALEAGYVIFEENIKHFKCWSFPEPLNESSDIMEMLLFDFPNIKLEFSNGNTFVISPPKYLASYAFIKNGICANMRSFDARMQYPNNVMVLGARMIAEHLMIFDNEIDRIGFMPIPNCEFTKKRKLEPNKPLTQISTKSMKKNNILNAQKI